MRDDDDGPSFGLKRVEYPEHRCLGPGIECTRRFVEHQHRGCTINCPGKPDPLPLPARKPRPAFAEWTVDPLCEARDDLIELREADRVDCPSAIDRNGGNPERDVGEQAVGGQEDRLWDMGNPRPPRPATVRVEHCAVDPDHALGR